MTSFLYSLMFYTFSILFFLNSCNFFFMWVCMEINLIMFIYFCFFLIKDKLEFKDFIMFYFLIQSFGSFLFLYSIYYKDYLGCLLDWFFFLSLTLKIGIFPLFFWILNLGSSLSPTILTSILTFQKVPMFLILFQSNFMLIEFFFFFSFIFGVILIFFSKNLKYLLISSSISSPFWVYFLYIESLSLYFIFFLMYSLIVLAVLLNFVSLDLLSVLILMSFLGFSSGLPPFSLFFFKFFLSNLFLECYYNEVLLIFWLLSFFCLLGYLKFFYHHFFFSKFLYLKQKFCFKKMSFSAYAIFFFMFFII